MADALAYKGWATRFGADDDAAVGVVDLLSKAVGSEAQRPHELRNTTKATLPTPPSG